MMNKNDQQYMAQKIRANYMEKQSTELDELRARIPAGLMEQEEDVLSYALFEQVAIKFFEWRKQQKYKLDANADAANGIHTI